MSVCAIKRSVLRSNLNLDLIQLTNYFLYREVSTIKCPKRFCYESMAVISSVSEKSVLCREMSAIIDVGYKEVSLYLVIDLKF